MHTIPQVMELKERANAIFKLGRYEQALACIKRPSDSPAPRWRARWIKVCFSRLGLNIDVHLSGVPVRASNDDMADVVHPLAIAANCM